MSKTRPDDPKFRVWWSIKNWKTDGTWSPTSGYFRFRTVLNGITKRHSWSIYVYFVILLKERKLFTIDGNNVSDSTFRSVSKWRSPMEERYPETSSPLRSPYIVPLGVTPHRFVGGFLRLMQFQIPEWGKVFTTRTNWGPDPSEEFLSYIPIRMNVSEI